MMLNVHPALEFVVLLAVDLPSSMKAGDSLKHNGLPGFGFSDGKIIQITDCS